MTIINLDTIAELVVEQGFPCYVEQTGGGCATIYAGELTETDDGCRAPILAGPGWFEKGGFGNGAGAMWVATADEELPPFTAFEQARAHSDDFYVGPDNEDLPLADVWQPDDSDDERSIANAIVRLLQWDKLIRVLVPR